MFTSKFSILDSVMFSIALPAATCVVVAAASASILLTILCCCVTFSLSPVFVVKVIILLKIAVQTFFFKIRMKYIYDCVCGCWSCMKRKMRGDREGASQEGYVYVLHGCAAASQLGNHNGNHTASGYYGNNLLLLLLQCTLSCAYCVSSLNLIKYLVEHTGCVRGQG